MTSNDYGYDFKILDSVMEVNENQKTKLIPAVKEYFKGDLKGKKIALWGLAFKPYTDDIREAPALYNIDELVAAGAEVVAYDAEAMPNVKRQIGDKITYAHDLYACLDGADALMVMTEWPEFRTPDMDRISASLKNKVIFDGRNIFEPDQMLELGFTYFSIGRTAVKI
jgi:UDPglucose 6-dehydrogenase